MIDWVKTLKWYEQSLWLIAMVFTIIFFYHLLSTVIKRKPGRKRKHLFSRFLSFKNIVAFMSMFGWVSISGIYQGLGLKNSLLFGLFGGLVLMAVMSVLFYFVQKIKENHRPEVSHNINNTGKAISKIGHNRTSMGQIKIKVDGIQKTMDAVTDFNHDIIEGTKIRVESVNEKGIFIIKPMQ